MSEWLSEQIEKAIVIRWVIVKCVLSCVLMLAVAWQVSTVNIIYSQLDCEAKLNLWVGVLILMIKDLISFFDTNVSLLMKGKLPIGSPGGNGDTTQITREQVQQVTVTTNKEKP